MKHDYSMFALFLALLRILVGVIVAVPIVAGLVVVIGLVALFCLFEPFDRWMTRR